MPAFKDMHDREWLVTVNVASVRAVRQRCGVNLADLQQGKLLEQLADVVTLVDVLFALIEPQARERNLTDEQFAAGLGGDVLEPAATALLEALCDFFPHRVRVPLRKTIAATRERLAALDQVLERDGDELIRQALNGGAKPTAATKRKKKNPTGNSSCSSPGGYGSTSARTHSASCW